VDCTTAESRVLAPTEEPVQLLAGPSGDALMLHLCLRCDVALAPTMLRQHLSIRGVSDGRGSTSISSSSIREVNSGSSSRGPATARPSMTSIVTRPEALGAA